MNRMLQRTGIVLVFSLVSLQAFSSGWPTGKKKWVLIPTWYQYLASSYRDPFSKALFYPSQGLYSSALLKMYWEYGLTNKLDLVGSIPYYLIRYKDQQVNQHQEGFADMELGLRYNLVNVDNRSFLSIQATGEVPAYHNDSLRVPFIGFADPGAEARLMYSGNRKAGVKDWYFNAEAAFREYFDQHGGISQASLLASAGLYLDRSNLVSADLSGTRSYSNSSAFNPLNLNGNTNFFFLKATLTYGHRISPVLWAYGGVFHDLYGRNTGIGKGFTLMLIYRSK